MDNDNNELTKTEEDEEYEVEKPDSNAYEGVVLAQKDSLCNIHNKIGIPSSRILINSQSMLDVFCNPKLLCNIGDERFSSELQSWYNVHKTKETMVSWYHPTILANLLSFKNVNKWVTFDSKLQEDGFIVHGSKCIFRPSKKGVY